VAYESYRNRRVTDVSGFAESLEHLAIAAQNCGTGDLGALSLQHLGLSSLYVGDFAAAETYFRRLEAGFPEHPVNASGRGLEQAVLLEGCRGDRSALEAYRMARLHELHQDRAGAVRHYREAVNTRCAELARVVRRRLSILDAR
jgi:hypothetical protein